ncbi:MAG: hypothetical protein IPJ79_08330 [Bacteroidetes bacterium]|nr:hypothetical protein [Bacteroidota bacterium]
MSKSVLYKIHPLFEFFLTFYVGYLISSDIRTFLLEGLTSSFKQIKNQYDFKSRKERLKINIDSNQAIVSEITLLNPETEDVILYDSLKKAQAYHKDAINELEEISTQQSNLFDQEDQLQKILIESLNPLTPITLMAVLYCLYLLIINGLTYSQELLTTQVWNFNLLIMLTFFVYFAITNLSEKLALFIVKIFKFRVATIIFFGLLVWFNIKYFSPSIGEFFHGLFHNDDQKFSNCLVYFSVLILILPIKLNALRYYYEKSKLNAKCLNYDSDYNKVKNKISINKTNLLQVKEIFLKHRKAVAELEKLINDRPELIKQLGGEENISTEMLNKNLKNHLNPILASYVNMNINESQMDVTEDYQEVIDSAGKINSPVSQLEKFRGVINNFSRLFIILYSIFMTLTITKMNIIEKVYQLILDAFK